jgi:hypothetical protein
VSPEDLIATIHYALGVPHDGEVHDLDGRPYRASDGAPVTALFG